MSAEFAIIFIHFFRTFLFSSRNLESCPELYSKVKSEKNFYFFREDFLDFLKDFFRIFLFSSRNLESFPELCSKVKSDKNFFFFLWGGDFLDFFIFVGKS